MLYFWVFSSKKEKYRKICKKVLTRKNESAILIKLSHETDLIGTKKYEKYFQKVLTKGKECGRIEKHRA